MLSRPSLQSLLERLNITLATRYFGRVSSQLCLNSNSLLSFTDTLPLTTTGHVRCSCRASFSFCSFFFFFVSSSFVFGFQQQTEHKVSIKECQLGGILLSIRLNPSHTTHILDTTEGSTCSKSSSLRTLVHCSSASGVQHSIQKQNKLLIFVRPLLLLFVNNVQILISVMGNRATSAVVSTTLLKLLHSVWHQIYSLDCPNFIFHSVFISLLRLYIIFHTLVFYYIYLSFLHFTCSYILYTHTHTTLQAKATLIIFNFVPTNMYLIFYSCLTTVFSFQ